MVKIKNTAINRRAIAEGKRTDADIYIYIETR
jgi:hypothetical protein